MKLPENHIAVRILAEYDGALLNAEGKPIVSKNGISLVEADEDMHADEELLNKPGMVCVGEIVINCWAFTGQPEVLELDGAIIGSELFLSELAVGDIVCIKQSEIDLEEPIYSDEISPIFLVPYWSVLCIMAGPGNLVPVGGYTMAKPVYPWGTVRELVDGKMDMVRKNAHGVIFDYKVQPLSGQGELVFVGEPLLGQPQLFRPGQRVLYNRWTSGPKYKIQGQPYYCVRHPDIAAVAEADADVVSKGEARYSRRVKRPIRKE